MAFFGKKKGRAARIASFGLLAGAPGIKNLFGGGSKDQEFITPPPFTGARPFSGADVGLDAPRLKTIADAYIPQILGQARGEGVGFDSGRRDIQRREYLADFNDYQDDILKKASAQASGQGLRGGIPSSISEQYAKNLSRARQSGLAGIDIEDLSAAREDRQRAIYAQPDIVSQGAGIQQNRAAFDLSEYNATQPTYLEPQQSNILPALIGAAGTIGGAYFGQPQLGALAGSYLANQIQPQVAQSPARRRIYNYNDPLLTSGGYGYRKPY